MRLATNDEDLSQQHAMLERTITEESQRPDPNFLKISELKREKLRIKDEIAHHTH